MSYLGLISHRGIEPHIPVNPTENAHPVARKLFDSLSHIKDICLKACSWWGSNPRPPRYKHGALTNCATRAIIIKVIIINVDFYSMTGAGFEPARIKIQLGLSQSP